MSTSCLIGFLDTQEPQKLYLLEKTHDGTEQNIISIFNNWLKYSDVLEDVECAINSFIRSKDGIDWAIYSHKYPTQAFIWDVQKHELYKTQIQSDLNELADYKSVLLQNKQNWIKIDIIQ